MDCFAYKNNGRCKALKLKKCEGTDCGFYKTEEQLNSERKKVIKRIKSLDKEHQKHIIDTYYKGKLG